MQCLEPDIPRWSPEKDCSVPQFFPHFLEIPQSDCTRRVIRTRSRIDSENLVNRTIPSDHAAHRGHQSKRIPSWMSKHPVFCSLSQQLHDDHRFSHDGFCALTEVLLNKAKKLTSRELSRKTLDSIAAKLLIASTALCADRNKHLGTLMRCL